MPSNESGANVWFGVAMFLGGLIAGVVLTFASGAIPMQYRLAPSVPTPQAPQAPQTNVQDRMIAYAADVGVDADAFENCLENNTYQEFIKKQMSEGQAAGVNGTPGNIVYDIKSKKGILVSGAQPFGNFQIIIDNMLKDPASAVAQPGVQVAQNVTPIDVATDHIRGSSDATIAVIEYSDYECPFCHSVHPTYQKIMQEYSGKVMWVYRHFPLESIHPDAMPLAIGAECVNELGGNDAYWAFSDKIMAE